MSKVEELRNKYSKVTTQTFNKFDDADKTPTKKYLEYYLKMWSSRNTGQSYCPSTTDALIRLVQEYDKLLPYISNKDIYAKEFMDSTYLKLVIAKAEEIKEEKTFIKEDHVVVLDETDEYVLLQPITHRGSLRYGAQTRWCTASRNDTSTYNRYTKGGLLVYLIDKKGNKKDQGKKLALYLNYAHDVFTDGFDVYNTTDHSITTEYVLGYGWSEETLFRIVSLFNAYFIREKRLKKSKDYVINFSDTLNKLNFETLAQHISRLEQTKKIDYTSDVQEQINNLVKNLNDLAYARFTTT